MAYYVTTAIVVILLLFMVGLIYITRLHRRLMVLSLGLDNYRRSQAFTFFNASKSGIIRFQFIVACAGVAWAFYACLNHFKLEQHPFANIGALWLPALALTISLVIFSNQLRPAAVIILAKSSPDTLRLQNRLLYEAAPFRTVSLLFNQTFREGKLASGHSFRTSTGSWEQSVADFARVVGVIILDLREGSDPVKVEHAIIHQLNLGYKTLVITKPEAASAPAPPLAKVVHQEEDAIQIVKKCLLEPGFRATPDNPISSWS